MHFEVVEENLAWIVKGAGDEVSFGDRDAALDFIRSCICKGDARAGASVFLRFQLDAPACPQGMT